MSDRIEHLRDPIQRLIDGHYADAQAALCAFDAAGQDTGQAPAVMVPRDLLEALIDNIKTARGIYSNCECPKCIRARELVAQARSLLSGSGSCDSRSHEMNMAPAGSRSNG